MSNKIIVEQEPDGLERALKKFKKLSLNTRNTLKRHEYYERPGVRARHKEEEARRKRNRRIARENAIKEKIQESKDRYFQELALRSRDE